MYGIGPTGPTFHANGLASASGCPGCVEHIQNITLRNIHLQTGGVFACAFVDGLVVENVSRWPAGSTCKR